MRKIARLGIALVGFWMLTYVPNLLTYASGMLPYEGLGSVPMLAAAFLPALAAVLIGLLLVANRNRLADQLFEDSDIDLGASGPDLLRAGLVLLGVSMIAYAVLAALSTGIFTVSAFVQERSSLGDVPYLSNLTVLDWLPSLVADAARLAIGLFLVLRAEALVRRLWFGRPDPSGTWGDLPRCSQCGASYDPEDYVGGTPPARCVDCGAELTIPSHPTGASS